MNDIFTNFTNILQEINIINLIETQGVIVFEILGYFVGIILLYLIFQFIKLRITLVIRDEVLKSRFRNWLNLCFVFFTTYVSVLVFSKHSSTILAISGVLSAALVFALQDFVSSFFAWVFILSKEKYRVGDIIKIAGTHAYIYGKVIKIEIFRTILEERMGDGDYNGNLNKEMVTGRTVSIPNNMVMKGAVMNFTLENKVMWHNYNLIITFDSDFGLTEELLNNILKEVFDTVYFKKHHIPISYQPKTAISIADNGVDFSIWFPVTVGKFREILTSISKQVLIKFKENKIKLAFTTITLDNPPSTTPKLSEPKF
jgi:small-conductance mechanosensitive channel